MPSFFINPIGASVGGLGTRGGFVSTVPGYGHPLPVTLAIVAGSILPGNLNGKKGKLISKRAGDVLLGDIYCGPQEVRSLYEESSQ